MPALRRSLILALQAVFLAAVIWFAYDRIADQWASAPMSGLDPRWGWILAATAIVLGTYFLLIEVWVRHLRAWGVTVDFAVAARMWFVANLGKYVPGKVWGLATMAFMAQRAGLSQVAVLGSSVTGMAIGMVAGVAVVVGIGPTVIDAVTSAQGNPVPRQVELAALGLSLLALASTPIIVPAAVRLGGRIARRTVVVPRLSAATVWGIALATGLSWILYGVAFALFAEGVLADPSGGFGHYIALYTASYLIGLATLIPGGIVAREGSLVLGLTALGLTTAQEAVVLAVTSRVWLTILEIAPGIMVLAFRRPGSAPGEREAPARP